MEPIFNETDENKIAPQPFTFIIGVSVLYVVSSYLSFFAGNHSKFFFYVANMAMFIYVTVAFIKYLQNFQAYSAVLILKLKILVVVPVFIITSTTNEYGSVTSWLNPQEQYIFRSSLYYAYYAASIFDMSGCILLGIVLRKIKGDFIGLLKQLGTVNLYFVSGAYIFEIVGEYYKPLGDWYKSDRNLWLHLFVYSYFIIPVMIMIAIFYRARKYFGSSPNFL